MSQILKIWSFNFLFDIMIHCECYLNVIVFLNSIIILQCVLILYRPFGNIIQSLNAITTWNMFLQHINMFYMGLNDINMPRTTMFNALRGLCICFMSSQPRNNIKNIFWKPKQFWSVLIAFELEHTRRSCVDWRTLRRTPGWQVLSLMTLALVMYWWWLARRLHAQAAPGQGLLWW